MAARLRPRVQAVAASCDYPDKPDFLTFRVAGGGCDASDHDQEDGKVTCSSTGAVLPMNPAETVTVSGPL